ncbi:hypothetical protein, partial [Bacillus cereus group sp. BfR-BA-00707]
CQIHFEELKQSLVTLGKNGIGQFNTLWFIVNSFLRIKEHIRSKLYKKRLKNDVQKYRNKKRELFANYLRTRFGF